MAKKRKPVHPGEILSREFLEPYEMSVYALAGRMDCPRTRVNDIVNGKRGITADTALRLGKVFNMSPEFWMNLNSHYELELAKDAVWMDINRKVDVLETV